MAQDQHAEPKSPMWLPALGVALFVVAAAAWVISPPFTRADVAPDAGVNTAAGAVDAGSSDAPPG